MADTSTLNVELRERAGKGASRASRREGKVPGVVYGDKREPAMVSMLEKELVKALETGTFFTKMHELRVGDKRQQVLVRDVQFHPVTDRPLHVDFLRVAGDAEITISIPCHFVNEEASPGLKSGGVLNIVRHDIELVVKASAIPEVIEIDLTGTEINDSIHISAVKLPEGASPAITDRDFTIATLAAPSSLLSAASEEGEGEGEGEGEESASEE